MMLESKIAHALKEHQIIKEADLEIYEYGLRTLTLKIISYLFAIVIAVLLRRLLAFAVILLCFMSIRKYAGGFHEDTAVKCFVVSQILFVAIEISSKYLALQNWGVWSGVFVEILGLVFIIKKAPVESVHHRLTDGQKRKYRRIALVSCSIWCLLEILLYVLNQMDYLMVIALSLGVQGILTIIPEKK